PFQVDNRRLGHPGAARKLGLAVSQPGAPRSQERQAYADGNWVLHGGITPLGAISAAKTSNFDTNVIPRPASASARKSLERERTPGGFVYVSPNWLGQQAVLGVSGLCRRFLDPARGDAI